MPGDPSEIADFLPGYAAECDAAGVDPLPVRELALLLDAVAEVESDPPPRPDS